MYSSPAGNTEAVQESCCPDVMRICTPAQKQLQYIEMLALHRCPQRALRHPIHVLVQVEIPLQKVPTEVNIAAVYGNNQQICPVLVDL